jgi:hypothetical protein
MDIPSKETFQLRIFWPTYVFLATGDLSLGGWGHLPISGHWSTSPRNRNLKSTMNYYILTIESVTFGYIWSIDF